MSGSHAKATRRDIRRAFGQTAADAVREHADLLARHDQLLDSFSRRITALEERLASLRSEDDAA